MTRLRVSFSALSWRWVLFFVAFISFGQLSIAQQPQYVTAVDAEGNTIELPVNRRPALYTQDFGDCQGNSLINVTRFDGAFYKDNMTVTFNFEGQTSIPQDNVMLYIGVFAYGESRLTLTFNPCSANIASLCPMNASVPIQANGIIPIGEAQLSVIPSIAFSIPDFEGQAILRVFSNLTESQIGCYSAVLTNGASFGHPAAVGSTLGAFTVIALVSSILVAIYGSDVASTRNHYAHSISILVVFAVFHHIYFTGALSMNWPSVLVAFWSNYAWAAGFIYVEQMQNSINQFLGSNKGNISVVGAAAAGTTVSDVGGGYDISQIYKRGLGHALSKRADSNATDVYPWHGSPVKPGLPLPGNFSGFAGTLAEENIPASNAFMTGLIWFLILFAGVAVTIIMLKLTIELLIRCKLTKTERLSYFRSHWLSFLAAALLRTVLIAFYMMIFLALFQFTLGGSAGVTAVAAVVFALFLGGVWIAAGYAFYYRLKAGKLISEPDRLLFKRRTVLCCVPWWSVHRKSQLDEKETQVSFSGSLPWWRIHFSAVSEKSVHEDEDYLKRFGWLFARFRRTRWFFFGIWLLYEFVRACFFGAAAGHAMTQVFGNLAVEFIALIAMIWMRPFEAIRLNAMMVYFLGFSKVSTVALSSAFDPRFNISRIIATVIGIVIIVIQGVLTIFLLIAIVMGAISSYISVTRYKEKERFRPRSWLPLRTKYLNHVEKAAADLPPPPPPPPPVDEGPKEPSFNVGIVHRVPKIEDEDEDNIVQKQSLDMSHASMSEDDQRVPSRNHRRSMSLRSQVSYSSLPYGARPSRASWSSREFELWTEDNRTGEGWSDSRHSHSQPTGRSASCRGRSSDRGTPLPDTVSTSSRGPSRTTSPRIVSPEPGFMRRSRSVLDDVEEDDSYYETDEVRSREASPSHFVRRSEADLPGIAEERPEIVEDECPSHQTDALLSTSPV
ncbi:hypothetical protein DTO021D3_4622 [Paecilomyces variotii]|nr:hypothetical protein DTO032I3_4394 [Paecilomyces variotii]KAJ9278424.1 hypothetical protein DTO021D3_4622 [Paecilomyces variotii]KAJ9339770.1 hypothetical protein DTO027B6_7680 [Paecilomyces variotii]KAJ9377907.1 hypothetical protein DTO032I4_7895 [Paecilomyces variotii]